MTPDYHTHTNFSDGISTHENYLNQAHYANIDELGFSDHFSIVDSHWSVRDQEIMDMKNRVQAIKNRDHLPVLIKFGAEIDYIPGKEQQTADLIDSLPLDYVIGSVHFLGNWNFDTDPQNFQGLDIDDLYDQYFTTVRASIQSGLFDIIGHIDVIKKFGHYPNYDPDIWYRKIVRSLQKTDCVVELNTNGLNKPCREFYPDSTFLQQCFDANIPVTLGSDAHEANQIGQYFGKAKEILKNIGYRKIATFEQRKKRMENLG